MRGTITRTLVAAAAAGATILGAAAPGVAAATGGGMSAPSGGTPIPTNANCVINVPPCGMAGYQGSGRDFRYAHAVITVPAYGGRVVVPTTENGPARNGPSTPGYTDLDPTFYMALDDSTDTASDYARVGIRPCSIGVSCPAGDTSGWAAFTQIVVNPGVALGIGDSVRTDGTGPGPGAKHPIPAEVEGKGIFVSVYLTPTGNSVHTLIIVPATTTTPGATYNDTFPVNGPVYTAAQALVDWTNVTGKPQPAVPTAAVRDTQFGQGGFTTLGGQRGTFTGPWALQAVEATTNGLLPPAGTVIARPSYLWTDRRSFGGLRGDAFGVWRFPS
jgi:hypothetical protein